MSSALYLARYGISSVIVEQATFPRFQIGESMTGECGGAGARPRLELEMTKRGHAVKHGVTVYGSGGNNDSWVPVMGRTADGLVSGTSWQVRRSDLDTMLLQSALNSSSDLIEGRADPSVDR